MLDQEKIAQMVGKGFTVEFVADFMGVNPDTLYANYSEALRKGRGPRMPSPETSRRNLEQARAQWRPPRPWRSPQETRVIKRLAWQWFMDEEPRCPLREIARRLGVSHTYVQKLVREFVANPNKMLRQTGHLKRGYGMTSVSANGRMQVPFERRFATFEQLNEAQTMSRKMRERGWLRSPAHREG
jgi:hypothetical protein